MRGEIRLDLTEVVRRGDLGRRSVTSDGGDVELARRNEGVEYKLAKGPCGLFK